MNKGQRIMANVNNVLRTNISSINELLKNNKNIKSSLTNSCTQLVKKPLSYITEIIPQGVIDFVDYFFRNNKAIIVLSDGLTLINNYFNGLKVTLVLCF